MPRLKKQILAGKVDQGTAIQQERACLRALQEYDAGETSVRQVIDALQRYNEILGLKDYEEAYRKILD